MATEKRVYSDLPIPPGEYLAEVLDAKGMAQAELARRIGRPIQAINEIIKGEKAITPATALQLEKALDVSANIWVGLESRYQLIKARQEKEADQFAEDSLIGAEKLCEFVRKADLSHEAIETFAREVGVSAGIVLGRLQHEGFLIFITIY